MVGKNMTHTVINMTDFQWHVEYNNTEYKENTDIMLLYLNGFSRMNLSGNITYLYIHDAQMYTVHYMSGAHNLPDMGWGKGFILYTAFFIRNNTCDKCIAKQYFHIKNTQSITPTDGSKFYGFKGYSGNEFKGEFVGYGDDVAFNFDKGASKFNKYKQAAIVSTYIDGDFIDTREHDQSGLGKAKSLSLFALLLAFIAGIVFVVFMINRMRTR